MNFMTVFKFRKKYIYIVTISLVLVLFVGYLCINSDLNKLNYKSYVIDTNNPIYNTEKTVYLTFDDGPSIYTDKLLDILKQYDVKATFFVIGATEIEKPDRDRLYKRIVDEGHYLGLHSYSHVYQKIYETDETYVQNLTQLQKEIIDATGFTSKIFRFPAGSSNNFCSKEKYKKIIEKTESLELKYFDWNVDSRDAVGGGKSKETLINSVVIDSKKLTYPVVLMHDAPSSKTTIDAVSGIIEQLKQSGYKFDTLDKCKYTIHQDIK